MKTLLILVGKTASRNIQALDEDYVERIRRRLQFDVCVVPTARNAARITTAQQNEEEGRAVAQLLKAGDHVILLDEHGREYRSMEFAGRLSSLFASSARRIVFIIGGPYGFSQQLRSRAAESMSLSRMTFSHQMVRLIFLEQLYRAHPARES